VNIAQLRLGLLVLYVLMMYVSAFPVTMTIRHTNVYEERSLGLYAEDLAEREDASQQTEKKENAVLVGLKRMIAFPHRRSESMAWSNRDFIRQQLHGQLGHDLWWIALAVLFITIIEVYSIALLPWT